MILLNRPSLQNLIGKKDLIGAEIGVKLGVNAKNMLTNLSIKKLYLIDSFNKKNGNEWKNKSLKNLINYKDKIKWLIFKSSEAAKYIKDEELDFVYIDGDHTYDGVKKDIKNYKSKVKMGGLIAGHDYVKSKIRGVKKVVDESFIKENINVASCLDYPINCDWWVWKI